MAEKIFDYFEWQNGEAGGTPLNAANLNKLNNGIDGIDRRVVALMDGTVPVGNAELLNGKAAGEFIDYAHLQAGLSTRVPKEPGKGLSTNDYTSEDKEAVEKIPGLESDTTELKENLTQLDNDLNTALYSDVAGGKNLFDANSAMLNTDWDYTIDTQRAIVNVDVEPNTVYTISRDNLNGYSATRIFEKTSKDATLFTREYSEISNSTITVGATTRCLCFLFIKSSGKVTIADILSNKIQVEQGTEVHAYTPFVRSNADLTENLTELEQKAITSTEEESYEPTVPRDADTLGGISASEYIKKSEFSIEKKVLGGITQSNGAIGSFGAVTEFIPIGFTAEIDSSVPNRDIGGYWMEGYSGTEWYFMCKYPDGTPVANKLVLVTMYCIRKTQEG